MEAAGLARQSPCNKISQYVEQAKTRDGRVAGIAATGLLAIASGAAWLATLAGAEMPYAVPVVLSTATLLLTELYKGAKGAVHLFANRFPAAMRLVLIPLVNQPKTGPTGIQIGTGQDVVWSQVPDPDLAQGIAELLKRRGVGAVYDFGCGLHNHYIKILEQHGFEALGIDGNIDVQEYFAGRALKYDLTEELPLQRFDCVMSIEVGAKIPAEYQNNFLDNINNLAAKCVILSWPVPGQKGAGQVNCRTNQQIINEMGQRGWEPCESSANFLKASANEINYWFQDTIMVFVPKREEMKS